MDKHIIRIKSSDYKYPTREERARVYEENQSLSSFGFEYHSRIQMLLEDRLPPEEVKRISDLREWDTCLLNKLGALTETNVLLKTSFHRVEVEQTENEKAINDYLFDYYEVV